MTARLPTSDFDEMKYVRLPNWAAWGRQGDGPAPASAGMIYQLGKQDHKKGADEEGGITDTTHEDPPPKINTVDAERLEGYITQMGRYSEHRRCLRVAYILRERCRGEDLDTAIRYLLDQIDANRAVNAIMRRLYG